jgi:hypothetical protein
MLAVRTPWRPLRRQQRSDLFPARLRQGGQPGNGEGSGEVKRRIKHGGCGQVPRAPAAMRLPCLPLVLLAPPRPVQMQGKLDRILLPHQLEEPPNLGDAVGNDADYVPLFAVARRATTTVA